MLTAWKKVLLKFYIYGLKKTVAPCIYSYYTQNLWHFDMLHHVWLLDALINRSSQYSVRSDQKWSWNLAKKWSKIRSILSLLWKNIMIHKCACSIVRHHSCICPYLNDSVLQFTIWILTYDCIQTLDLWNFYCK